MAASPWPVPAMPCMILCCRCCVAPSPILSCSLMGVSRPRPPPGPVSQGALCTPRVLANAVNKAMFSVLAGVRLCCDERRRRSTPTSGLGETASALSVSRGTYCHLLRSANRDGRRAQYAHFVAGQYFICFSVLAFPGIRSR